LQSKPYDKSSKLHAIKDKAGTSGMLAPTPDQFYLWPDITDGRGWQACHICQAFMAVFLPLFFWVLKNPR